MTDNGNNHNNNNNNNNDEALRLRLPEEQAEQLLPKNGSAGQTKIAPPTHTHSIAAASVPQKVPAKKKRDKSDLGEDFVAPDGGWGWLVSVASGVNIVSDHRIYSPVCT